MDIFPKAVDCIKSAVRKGAKRKAEKNPPERIYEHKYDYAEGVSERFTAGFGFAEMIPEEKIPGRKKYYIAGYRINNPAVGVLDIPRAKAFWVDDNTGRGGVVFVAVDCVGLFSSDVKDIKNSMSVFLNNIGCRSINICATHTHAGIDTMGMWGPLPRSGRDKKYIEIVKNAVRHAVEDAYYSRKDGRIFVGSVKTDEGFQRADRPPHVFSDVVTRFHFVPDDGSRDVYIVNFASHPEALEGRNSMVSADFPAYTAKYVDEHLGGDFMYFSGAIGGIRTWPLDDNNVISMLKTAQRLGEYVCSVKDERELKASINILKREFYVDVENPVFYAAGRTGIIPAEIEYTGSGDLNISLKTEMTYISFGGINMLLLPCELFPELLLGGYLSKEESSIDASPDINPEPLCDIIEDKNLLVFGLANDEIGYVLAPNDYFLSESNPFIDQPVDKFGRRHYPETNSVGSGAAYTIADNFKEIVKIIKSK